MKNKILLSLLMALTFAGVEGQTQKGCKLFGSSIGGFSISNNESTTTYSNTPTVYKSEGSSFSIGVYPNVAWFIANNLALGSSVSLSMYSSNSKSSNTSSSSTSTSKYTSPSLYIGPFVRFYFGSDSKGKPFAEAGMTFGRYSGKSRSETSSGSSSETKTIPVMDRNIRFLVGYEYFFSAYLGLFASFGVQFANSETKYEYRPSTGTGYDYTNTYKNMYMPFNVGLQIHCPGKRNKTE